MDETAPEIKHRKTLLALFIPIFFETLFLMLEGIADTLMLLSVGDDAVGVVGMANTYIGCSSSPSGSSPAVWCRS